MHTIIRDNYDPIPNEYHETIVVDEAREKRWLFDCDGVFQDITNVKVVSERGESENYAASQKWVTEEVEALETTDQSLQDNLDAEEAGRIAADTEIWDEIEALEAASDVVDIVGTYEELEDYDTSALKDNDIIKVLQDETHDDAIAYYRWDTATDAFTFVGVEGPYYTASETDTLLAGKQDKLVAGSNIQIAADGKTISATDTTYSAGTGISIDANNVISSTAVATLYPTTGQNTDGAMTQKATTDALALKADASSLAAVATSGAYSDLSGAPTIPTRTSDLINNGSSGTSVYVEADEIFTGATSSAAGTSGLVPAPAAGDEGKFLQGDGTWATVSAGPTVVQTTGQSATDVMSQKAVTDIIGDIETILQTLNSGTGAQQ